MAGVSRRRRGGVVGDDEFYDIYLLRGQNGLFNNFGEILYEE